MIAENWFLLGAPWDCSGTGRGEQDAPGALRAAGVSALVGRDLGDVPTLIASAGRDGKTGILALPGTAQAAHELSMALSDALVGLPGRRPLVLGGDCSILLGIFPALRQAFSRIALWYVDGHPDYLDGKGSETGETADMVLALLTGRGDAPLIELGGPPPMVSATDVVLLGHRTANLDEGSAAEVAGVPVELRRLDAAALVADAAAAGDRAAAWLSDGDRPIWLHLDLDVLDPAVLPAVTYPQPDGPDWEQLAALLTPLAQAPQLLGVSVADFRPDLDPTGGLALRVVELLAKTLP